MTDRPASTGLRRRGLGPSGSLPDAVASGNALAQCVTGRRQPITDPQ